MTDLIVQYSVPVAEVVGLSFCPDIQMLPTEEKTICSMYIMYIKGETGEEREQRCKKIGRKKDCRLKQECNFHIPS